MASANAAEWVKANVRDVEASKREALAVFARHGWGPADLDFLQYEGQTGDPGNGDPEFEAALDLLGRLREAGVPIR